MKRLTAGRVFISRPAATCFSLVVRGEEEEREGEQESAAEEG